METSLCGLLATYEVASQKEEDAAQPEETTPRIHPALPEGPLQEDGENNPHGAQPGSRSTGRLMVTGSSSSGRKTDTSKGNFQWASDSHQLLGFIFRSRAFPAASH